MEKKHNLLKITCPPLPVTIYLRYSSLKIVFSLSISEYLVTVQVTSAYFTESPKRPGVQVGVWYVPDPTNPFYMQYLYLIHASMFVKQETHMYTSTYCAI
jgi:hypothetical protein